MGLSLVAILFWVGYGVGSKDVVYHGGCDQTLSPYLEVEQGSYAITYCDGGDSYVGLVTTSSFISERYLIVHVSGYPEGEGIQVELHSAGESKYELPLNNAGEIWKTQYIELPTRFIGKEVQIVLQDSSMDPFGWAGIGVETDIDGFVLFELLDALFLLIMIFSVFALFLLAVPGKNYFDKVVYFFVLSGLTSYATFFLYFFHEKIGAISSVTILGFLFLYVSLLLFKRKLEFQSLTLLAYPFFFSLFVIFIGWFPYFSLSDPTVAASKWLDLPPDNWIPKIFGDQLLVGEIESPMFGDWLSSDRGPIQTGFYVLLWPLLGQFSGFYQILGTSLQCLALLPLVFLIRFVFNDRFFVFLSLLIFAFSSLFLVNSAYVWPKMLALSYCMLAFLLFFTSAVFDLRRKLDLELTCFIGALAGLSLLSHGSTFFSLLVIPIIFLIKVLFCKKGTFKYRCIYLLKFGSLSAFFFFLFMAPWLMYQSFVDPPGDRLLKWHFAGQIAPTDKSFLAVIIEAYGGVSLNEWIASRHNNLLQVVRGGFFSDLTDALINRVGFSEVVSNGFYYTFYSYWFFSPIYIFLSFFVVKVFSESSRAPRIPTPLVSLIVVSFFRE